MKEQPTKRQFALLGLIFLVCIGLDLALAWFGQLVMTVLSIIIGVVVGLVVWMLTDFQTGFFCGFLGWIAGWIFLFLMRFILELAVDFVASSARISKEANEFDDA